MSKLQGNFTIDILFPTVGLSLVSTGRVLEPLVPTSLALEMEKPAQHIDEWQG